MDFATDWYGLVRMLVRIGTDFGTDWYELVRILVRIGMDFGTDWYGFWYGLARILPRIARQFVHARMPFSMACSSELKMATNRSSVLDYVS